LPILIAPPSNEGGFEPSRSVVPATWSTSERASFEAEFQRARQAEVDPAKAMRLYRGLLNRHHRFAEAHFRYARMLERTEDWPMAMLHYVRARDCDGLPIRCPSDFLSVIGEVAARHDCILIDGPAEFRAASPHLIVDDHLIQDAHHPNLNGTVLLAQLVLREIFQRSALSTSGPAPSVSPAECAAHFGLDAEKWAAVCDRTSVHFRRTAGYRYDPTERLAKADAYAAAAKALARGESPESLGLIGPEAAGPFHRSDHSVRPAMPAVSAAGVGGGGDRGGSAR
jgi:hypothetical protein